MASLIHTSILWNRLPFYLRNNFRPSEFKTKLVEFTWTHLVKCEHSSEDEFHESMNQVTDIFQIAAYITSTKNLQQPLSCDLHISLCLNV